MKHLRDLTIIALVAIGQVVSAQTKTSVAAFHKVIISPHIAATFIQGDEESVTILERTVDANKINIEVNRKTLRVYLDDAKETTKHKKVLNNGVKMKVPIYKGKVLTIKVTYKTLDNLSLRGEQQATCTSLIDVDGFYLKIYGESQVTFNEVNIKDFDVDVYGESQLTIKKGITENQRITAYGEGDINLEHIDNKNSILKAYGESKFRVQSSKRIKFTSYGEAQLYYKGQAELVKGLSLGASEINRID